MNLNEAMRRHKELWLKISKTNIDISLIFNYLKQICIEDENILNNCYLCHFSALGRNTEEDCERCPCMEVEVNELNLCLDGLYEKVVEAFLIKDKQLFKELAIKIANLPVINSFYKSI